MRRTVWPVPRPLPNLAARSVRIGLFFGASQEEKHPDAAFWAGLTNRLLRAGHKPVLLSGEAERALGGNTASLVGIPAINLCGRFNVGELVRFLAKLDVVITPDTGPMHIAAWLGTPVLNLSLGPVSAWETGPRPPGHHVLRVDLGCSGCWHCAKDGQLCRTALTPGGVAAALNFLCGKAGARPGKGLRGLELLHTGVNAHGLYTLHPFSAATADPARLASSRFWQVWFGASFGRMEQGPAAEAFTRLAGLHPRGAEDLRRALASFTLALTRSLRSGADALLADNDLWRETDELARPFAGYAQMFLQNEGGSRQARVKVLAMAEELASF